VNRSGEFMQLKTILIFTVLICSSLSGCVGDTREEKDIEKEDLRKMEDKVISTDIELKFEGDVDEIKMTQKSCEDLRGIWIEDREHCHFEDEERNETSESNMTQEDCERRGGTWYETREHCHFEDEERNETSESNMTQEDCEERGGTWTEAENRDGAYYCHFEDEEREEQED